MLNIPLPLRLALVAGSLLFFLVLCVLLRHKKLSVQYSIIWLAAAVAMLLVAIFPVIIAVLGDLLQVEMPANLVFALLFVFVLLLLLSLSTIVTGFAERIKRLTQHQALLEERLRRLEAEKQSAEQAANAPAQEVASTQEKPGTGPASV
ncbi:DUF2304 family protein [Clostridia bacterium OttesenSCG-928-O13]|nr:DUF2304 family protein [Clostridia bacterium OttesenSCG-928-O13]